jgi:hypothetical protein
MKEYVAVVSKVHIKIISKALDFLKSIARGEIIRASDLIAENKNTTLKYSDELEECFDARIRSLKNSLYVLEEKYFPKYLNILQLGEFGLKLTAAKKKFINYSHYFHKSQSDKSKIQVNENDLEIIRLACFIYYNIQSGYLIPISMLFDGKNLDFDKLNNDLEQLKEQTTSFADNSILPINSLLLNRKAKWCYDIMNSIDNINNIDDFKQQGTLPLIKYKNG